MNVSFAVEIEMFAAAALGDGGGAAQTNNSYFEENFVAELRLRNVSVDLVLEALLSRRRVAALSDKELEVPACLLQTLIDVE